MMCTPKPPIDSHEMCRSPLPASWRWISHAGWYFPLAFFCLSLIAGCQSEADESLEAQADLPAHSFKKFVRPPQPQPDPVLGAGFLDPPLEPPGTTAQATVEFLIDGVRKRQPERFVLFLPLAWRKDFNNVMHEAGWSMDGLLWSKSFQLVGRFSTALKSKLPLLSEAWGISARQTKNNVPQAGASGDTTAEEPKMNRSLIEQNLAEAVDVANLLAFSRVTDLEQLRRGSIEDILRDSGRRVIGRLAYEAEQRGETPFALFDRLEVTTVTPDNSPAGSPSIVRLHDPVSGQSHEIEFIKVDETWVPRSIAEAWPEFLVQTRDWAKTFDKIDWEQLRPSLTANLANIESAVGRVETATTPAEILVPLTLIGAEVGQMMSTLSPQSASQLPQVGPSRKVTVIIDRPLAGDDLTRILEQLVAASPEPSRTEYVASTLNGRTIVELGPVEDPAAFAGRLAEKKAQSPDEKSAKESSAEFDATRREIHWSPSHP